MELKKLVLATAVFGALGGLYGCSGDEDVNINIEDNDVTSTINEGDVVDGGGNDEDSTFLPDNTAAINASLAAITGSSQRSVVIQNPATGNNLSRTAVQLPSAVLEDITLDSDVIYFMGTGVVVGDGNTDMGVTDGSLANGDPVTEVTMTIEAGTQILSDEEGVLVITRGSDIVAEGTAAAPIVFSSDDPGLEGGGEWGGIVVHGYGEHNVGGACTPASGLACNIEAEGATGVAGGHNNDDSSGVLRYVVLAEGGTVIADNNEINGLSLVAVGSGTVIDYIQVHNNLDDGVEFFGGAVSASHLVLTGNQDDSIDWDEGWIGNVQFALVVQTETDDGTSHTGIEADSTSGGSVETVDHFFSTPTIANATFVGGPTQIFGHVLKDRTAGFIHNTIITGASGALSSACVRVNADTETDAGNGNIVYTNIIGDCASFQSLDTDTTATPIPDANLVNIIPESASLDSDYISTNPSASGVDLPDFAAFAMANPLSETENTSGAGFGFSFDTTANFIGAINPDGSDIWYEGWIIEGSLP